MDGLSDSILQLINQNPSTQLFASDICVFFICTFFFTFFIRKQLFYVKHYACATDPEGDSDSVTSGILKPDAQK